MAAAIDTIPELAPPPKPARPRVLLVGTSLAVAGVFVGFMSLIGIYAATRASTLAAGQSWLPDGTNIPLTPATMSLVTFALSGVSMAWAIYAVGRNDRPNAYLALGLTLVFGIAVINATTFLYSQMGLGIADSAAGVLIYTITGAHLGMIVIAMVYAAVMTFRTLGGEYSGRDREGLVSAALFWYATIAVYAVIWYAIYVTK